MTYEKMMRMRDQYITPEIKNKILSENKGLNQKTLDGFLGIEATDPERYDVFPDQEQEIPSPAPEPKSVSVSAERSDPVRGIPYLTAAFAGCCSRIRATTQAVQFIKYIQLSGRTACYIEMNESRYVKRLGALYSVAGHDPELGRVRYQNIDLYYKQSRISEILKLGYDYYVYDFGSFEDSHFNPAFFLDKSLPVAVMGSSPGEFDAMKKVIDAAIDSDTRYIFSFVDEAEQPDILELMEDKAAHTTFVAYAPDPFVYLSDRNDIYSRIAVAGNPVARESGRKKARRGLFGRRGKT
ncbi:MAG TPA: hypothetical protein DEQ02_00870 [Ruminococcaceae bacterium]|nr:hypothetical protein [Oscillospiraceae bacterium]